jgi:S1-C subfamily serine protease
LRPQLLLLPFLLLPAATLAQPRPTPAALRKAWEQNAPSLVTVKHENRSGPGVIAGAGGQVITSVNHVGLEKAKVLVDGAEHEARVVAANAKLKIAVLQIADSTESHWPAAAVREEPLPRGTWLVGALPPKGAKTSPSPLAGRVMKETSPSSPFLMTDFPLPPGSPLFDARGRLVAVVVEYAGRIGSRALPISAIRKELDLERANR